MTVVSSSSSTVTIGKENNRGLNLSYLSCSLTLCSLSCSSCREDDARYSLRESLRGEGRRVYERAEYERAEEVFFFLLEAFLDFLDLLPSDFRGILI